MDSYFNNIPNIGSLRIEHIFYEYEEPILFVCLDKREQRYLCSCSRIAEQWIVGEITKQQLLDIIDKTLAIDRFFRTCASCFCLKWDGKNLCMLHDIPFDAYPKDNSFLRLRTEQTDEYRSFVNSSFRDESQQIVLPVINANLQEDSFNKFREYLSIAVEEFVSAYNMQARIPLDKAIDTDATQFVSNLISKTTDISRHSLGTIKQHISAELYPSKKKNETSRMFKEGAIFDRNQSTGAVNNGDMLSAA